MKTGTKNSIAWPKIFVLPCIYLGLTWLLSSCRLKMKLWSSKELHGEVQKIKICTYLRTFLLLSWCFCTYFTKQIFFLMLSITGNTTRQFFFCSVSSFLFLVSISFSPIYQISTLPDHQNCTTNHNSSDYTLK